MDEKWNHRPWELLESKEIGNYRIFRLSSETYLSPRLNRPHRFFVLLSPDWVNVVPVTWDGRVVLIRQFRPGSREVTIEVPGGMVDSRDRDPADAAVRELEEETGYLAGRIVKTGKVRPNPAILRNWCHMFLALDVRPSGTVRQDPGEDVHHFLATWQEVETMVREGKITHSLVLNTLSFARRWLDTHGGSVQST